MKDTENFYFTYGADHKYGGGWTVVEAENLEQAIEIFALFHPCDDGLVCCAGIYSEHDFENTKMCREGNFGKYMVEHISVNRKEYYNDI